MSIRSTATRRRRRWSDVARGFVATLGVLALAVGVPAGLVVWIGWPLPAGVPSVEEVSDALRDTYVPDEFLIKALALVCWLVWVELMAALVVEAVAYAGGRQAGRVPLASMGVQRVAARLVATAALLGALAATRGVPEIASRALAPPAANLVVADPAGDPRGAEPDDAAGRAGASATAAHPVYEVQPRDTLWRIAECHLGDPFRWPEIYELNEGLPQADGQALRDADLIYPGWRLRLPTDATGLGAPASDTAEASPSAPAGTDGRASGGPGGPGAGASPAASALPAGGAPHDHGADAGAGAGAGAGASNASTGSGAGMVLLGDDDFADGNAGHGGGLLASGPGPVEPASPGRSAASAAAANSARPSPSVRDTASPTSPAGPGSGTPTNPIAPTSPAAPASPAGAPAGGAAPTDDASGMVLLPEDDLLPSGGIDADGWLVAGGDEEQDE